MPKSSSSIRYPQTEPEPFDSVFYSNNSHITAKQVLISIIDLLAEVADVVEGSKCSPQDQKKMCDIVVTGANDLTDLFEMVATSSRLHKNARVALHFDPSYRAKGLHACRDRIATELKEPLTRRSKLRGDAISLAPFIATAQNIISETDRVFKVFLRKEVYWKDALPDDKPVLPVEHTGSGAGNGTSHMAEVKTVRPTDDQKVIGTTIVRSKKPSLWCHLKKLVGWL